MYCFKRWLIWIYRWRHCRGFGVQSPSDYSFIRYVINEHYPYYAYDDLKKELPNVDKLNRKKAELLFRVSNWKQAKNVFLQSDDDIYKRYISSGSRKSGIGNKLTEDDSLMVVSALSVDDNQLQNLMNNLKNDSLIFLDDIDKVEGRNVWEKIIGDERATITFDLYYAGIAMNVAKRYKHNYIVNF